MKYFRVKIRKDINRIGRFTIQQFDLSSVTTNFAESMNAVLKRLIEWERRPVDVAVLALVMLCQYYTLRKHLQHLYRLTKDVPIFPPATVEPDEIVSHIRNSTIECQVS